ncbi:pirin [Pandoraea terrae]|uniref:Pirin n=1 Tax=Pandoraea terrae TaxID=1537710 RepID=A0A5E4VHR2_9BURK|nr:pirin family protein [Pandoraea terrae]VVE10939.1 pirin [Pandoraea terrae]
MSNPQTGRTVSRVFTAAQTQEGAGFHVNRPFPTRMLADFDPFLLLDEMGPMQIAPGNAKGAPDHPHRGFETVTYLLAGELEHKDSRGHAGRLTPGDVQWMTAGAGVVHSEMPSQAFQQSGGAMHGFQLWVNLPRTDKMMAPRYQELPAANIPTAQSRDGKVSVRVIAGEALGTRAAIKTRTPILYQHFTLQPGGVLEHAVPADFNVFAYVIEGTGRFGAQALSAHARQMVVFDHDGVDLTVRNDGDAPLSFLLIGGRPLNEPVARYGPFVMNTEDEIRQAILDFQAGRMGQIRA